MLDLYESGDDEIKLSILKELIQYVYPKLKPRELDEGDEALKSEQARELLTLDDKELAEAMRERLKALAIENE